MSHLFIVYHHDSRYLNPIHCEFECHPVHNIQQQPQQQYSLN